jgi:hypothetical protein
MTFSYGYFFGLFLLQVMALGIIMSKLGQTETKTTSVSSVFYAILICILSGLALYWWQ